MHLAIVDGTHAELRANRRRALTRHDVVNYRVERRVRIAQPVADQGCYGCNVILRQADRVAKRIDDVQGQVAV